MYSFINCSIHFLFALHWAMFNWYFFSFFEGWQFILLCMDTFDWFYRYKVRQKPHAFNLRELEKKSNNRNNEKKRYKKRPLHNEISTDEMNFNGIYFLFPAVHTLPSPIRSFFPSLPFSLSPPQLADCKQTFSSTHTDKIQPKANAIFRKRTEQTHISNAFICFWIPSKQQRHCFATVFYHSFLHQQVHHCLSACVCDVRIFLICDVCKSKLCTQFNHHAHSWS